MYRTEDLLLFFEGAPGSLPLYQALEEKLTSRFVEVDIRVQKTQISFYNRHLFACASLARVLPGGKLPRPFLTVTFGLPARVDSPRIAACVEPYPNRWTHHVVISSPDELDEELMGWLDAAYAFSLSKR